MGVIRMTGFRFFSTELEQEIVALKKISASFFERESPRNLEYFLNDFRSIKSQPVGTCHELVLKPLRTRISNGEYEADGKGKKIFAILSGIWDIRVQSSGTRQQMEFGGKASLTTEVFSIGEPSMCLAKWQLDLGAKDSPGCYVHAQIPWGFEVRSTASNPLPVPRLPSLFVTPMSTVEFVLGELFQNCWKRRIQRSDGDTTNWYRLQKNWLQRLLTWYLIELREEGAKQDKNKEKRKRGKKKGKGKENQEKSFSPWMVLKDAKPDGSLFVEDQ